jgi:hypothetical protein
MARSTIGPISGRAAPGSIASSPNVTTTENLRNRHKSTYIAKNAARTRQFLTLNPEKAAGSIQLRFF